MISAWTALTRIVAWAVLEQILCRMRQFFSSALARLPGARRPACAVDRCLVGGELAAEELLGGPVVSHASVRDRDGVSDAVVGGLGERGDTSIGQGDAEADDTGGAGIVAGSRKCG
jgi:hypothetical protein